MDLPVLPHPGVKRNVQALRIAGDDGKAEGLLCVLEKLVEGGRVDHAGSK